MASSGRRLPSVPPPDPQDASLPGSTLDYLLAAVAKALARRCARARRSYSAASAQETPGSPEPAPGSWQQCLSAAGECRPHGRRADRAGDGCVPDHALARGRSKRRHSSKRPACCFGGRRRSRWRGSPSAASLCSGRDQPRPGGGPAGRAQPGTGQAARAGASAGQLAQSWRQARDAGLPRQGDRIARAAERR